MSTLRMWQGLGGMRSTLFQCSSCNCQTSVTAGTVFQDTRKPLATWFRAMWFVTSQKNGASALGLQRVLGLGSYRTAWSWLHKLRRAMVRSGRDRLTGWVEVDETSSQPKATKKIPFLLPRLECRMIGGTENTLKLELASTEYSLYLMDTIGEMALNPCYILAPAS